MFNGEVQPILFLMTFLKLGDDRLELLGVLEVEADVVQADALALGQLGHQLIQLVRCLPQREMLSLLLLGEAGLRGGELVSQHLNALDEDLWTKTV